MKRVRLKYRRAFLGTMTEGRGKSVLLQSREDIVWFRNAHAPSLPRITQSVLVFGNEDYPTFAQAYAQKNPTIHDIPIAFYQ